MIDRQFGEIVFECDACDETLDTLEREWVGAKREFDRRGWKAELVDREWLHTCPKCQ